MNEDVVDTGRAPGWFGDYWISRNLPEQNAYIVAVPKDSSVAFFVHETIKTPGVGLWFQRNDSMIFPDPVTYIGDAQVFLDASVKWDGCTNWRLGAVNGNYEHACTRDELGRTSAILQFCWDWAKELLGDKWDGDKD